MHRSLPVVLLIAATLTGTSFGATPQLKQNPKVAKIFERLGATGAKTKASAGRGALPKAHTAKSVVRARIDSQKPMAAAARPDGQITFQTPSVVAAYQFNITGPTVSEIAAAEQGDVNNDGYPDLVSTSFDGTIDVFLNDGTGRMTLAYTASLPLAPVNQLYVHSQICVSDLNGDGNADVIVLDASNSAFIVFMSNGDGTLQKPVTYNIAPQNGGSITLGGGAIAIADITGDGHPDLVAVSAGNSADFKTTYVALQMFPGNGDGTFGKPVESDSTLNDLYGMALGQTIVLSDVNGDGHLDAAVMLDNYGINGTAAGDGVMIANGSSNGTFSSLSSFSAFVPNADNIFYGYSAMAVTDMNGDGNADILFNDGSGNITEALNLGGGTFGPVNIVVANAEAEQFSIGDLNGDKLPDMILYEQGQLTVYIAQSDGTLALQGRYIEGLQSGYQEPQLAHFAGTQSSLGAAYVDTTQLIGLVYPGNGDGTLAAAPITPLAAGSVISVADLNGDGIADYVAYDATNESQNDGIPDIVSYLSDGKGGFTKVLGISGSVFANAGATFVSVQDFAKDLNGDGIADLLLSTGQNIEIALGNGDGSFKLPTALSLAGYSQLGCEPGVAGVGAGKDGAIQFVVPYGPDQCNALILNPSPTGRRSESSGDQPPSGVFAYTNGGTNVNFIPLGASLTNAALTDLDNDGVLDLVAVDSDSPSGTYGAYAVKGLADGVFDPTEVTPVAQGYSISSILPADFNADGKMDLAFTTNGIISSGSPVSGTAGVLLLTGNANGSFGAQSVADAGVTSLDGVWTDMNGDGLPDLVVTDYVGTYDLPHFNFFRTIYQTAVLINAGDGTLPVKVGYNAENSGPIFAADANGDGSIDIIAVQGGGAGVFLNRGTTSLALTASTNSISQGSPVTLTANLTQNKNAANATGSVTFSVNGAIVGSAAVSSGTATYTTSSLPVGTDKVTATYGGDDTNNAASASTTVTVNAVAANFSISATPSTLVVVQGNSAVSTLTIASNAAFGGALTFNCTGAPSGATCTVNPGSITLGASQSTSVSVVVTTSAKNGPVQTSNRGTWGKVAGGLSAASLLCLMIPRRRMTVRLMVLCIVSLSLLGGLAGCGGGSNGNGNPGTPVGTSTLTISASSGNLSQTQAITLTVNKQ
jgi:hypothetical protein